MKNHGSRLLQTTLSKSPSTSGGFGEIDLDYYRQRMSPKLFTAFVRHMGVVPGSPGLDVVELTTHPDF